MPRPRALPLDVKLLHSLQGIDIDGMCVVALALATITMSGATIHPRVMMLLMSGW
jgi:hypothetical protein